VGRIQYVFFELRKVEGMLALAREFGMNNLKPAAVQFVAANEAFGKIVFGGRTPDEDVRLLRENVGPKFGVKASGGIRNTVSALAMIEAGATRIGTSNGMTIVQGLPVLAVSGRK